ncbi:MAG TPA: DAK2 domain-containing protein [Streptosporangiaceae bacterium]|jgi:dihydroxyacetone kinase-like protein|nr:DAK2 domain-containing protein [Streptosporangiaceae bacterium]
MTRGIGIEVALRLTEAGANTLENATGELCELDSVAGDGDHGLAMAAAAKAIRRRLAENPPPDLAALIELLAAEFGAVGGSMGALLSVAFDALGGTLVTPDIPRSAYQVADYLRIVCAALSEFGGAKVGDKTIVDAVASAQTAAAAAADEGAATAETLSAAANGANAGAESTASMVARVGRASRLGERSRGSVDPGARSFALVLTAIAQAYATGDRS